MLLLGPVTQYLLSTSADSPKDFPPFSTDYFDFEREGSTSRKIFRPEYIIYHDLQTEIYYAALSSESGIDRKKENQIDPSDSQLYTNRGVKRGVTEALDLSLRVRYGVVNSTRTNIQSFVRLPI